MLHRYFLYPLISKPPKRSKFGERKLDLENFCLILRLTLEVSMDSSLKPNKSSTVNRQIGGEKLKYVGLLRPKFYIGVHVT